MREKLHRFFVDQLSRNVSQVGDFFALHDLELSHQLKNVLKFHKGERAVLIDDSGEEFVVELVSFGNDNQVGFKLLEKRFREKSSDFIVTMFLSLIKKDRFEEAVQKCTELGAQKIIPVISERSQVKNFSRERLEKIIKEACEQSERTTLTVLGEVYDLKEGLAFDLAQKENEINIYFDPGETKLDLVEFHKNCDDKSFQKNFEKKSKNNTERKIGIFIGPEGGWTSREIDLFKSKKFEGFSLGQNILRAETAAIVSLACFTVLNNKE